MEHVRGRPRDDARPEQARPALPARTPAQLLLALQRDHGNQAVARMFSPARPVLARSIVITPEAYAAGVGVAGGAANMTPRQFRAYMAMAVKDDLDYAKAYAQDPDATTLQQQIDAVKNAATMAQSVAALTTLIGTINAVQAQEDLKPNRDTRYATTSKDFGYAHTGSQVAWRDDGDMWKSFGAGFGAIQGPLATDEPRGKEKDEELLPVTILPWAEAQRLLPRPLLNLIFDVRFQLEDPGGGQNRPVVDEREDQTSTNTEPKEHGSLRSWHQDSKEILPPNNMGAEIPAHAQALHTHYTDTSGVGTGSAIEEGQEGPGGYAEYTATGSNSVHNTKIVLDYIQKRVYLTLTHYQYWAMLELASGAKEMWTSDTQVQVLATGKLETRQRDETQPKVVKATMMSPWMEVLTS